MASIRGPAPSLIKNSTTAYRYDSAVFPCFQGNSFLRVMNLLLVNPCPAHLSLQSVVTGANMACTVAPGTVTFCFANLLRRPGTEPPSYIYWLDISAATLSCRDGQMRLPVPPAQWLTFVC